MKKLLFALVLCFVMFSPVLAWDNYDGRDKNMFAALGVGARYIGEAFIEGGMSYGYYPNKSNRFSAEFNVGYYSAGKVGGFEYGYYPYYDDFDGDINYSYLSFEFLFSWNYVVQVSDKVGWRFGPSIGLLSVTGSESYDPDDIKNLPDSHSETKTAFEAGIGTGIIVSLTRNLFLDFGYRYLANSGIVFDRQVIRVLGDDLVIEKKEFDKSSHQFNITAGWRF